MVPEVTLKGIIGIFVNAELVLLFFIFVSVQ